MTVDQAVTIANRFKPADLGLHWHVHHAHLFEWCYNPKERALYIAIQKPPHERRIRLKLMRKIKMTPKLKQFFEKYHDHRVEHVLKRDSKLRAYMDRLHKKQCFKSCPWNGRTIFPRQ
jgi:hypothetical protein